MNEVQERGGMKVRIMNSGIWTVAGHVAETLIRLVSTLIMTRLLAPESFGLIAVAMTIPAGLAMLSDVGIHSNIIRKSGALGIDFIRTAWTIQFIRGVLLSSIAIIMAALFSLSEVRSVMPSSSVFADSQFPAVLAAMGLLATISGLTSINLSLQERAIELRPLVLLTIASKILGLLTMLIWGVFDRTVWALVVGTFATQITVTLLSHTTVPGEGMRISWNKHHRKELLADSKWTALASTSGFIANQGDRLVFATLLTAQQMGYYAIAVNLVDVVRALLQKIHGQVTLPVLSELFRERPTTVRDAYYRYRKPIDAFAFTAVGFLGIAGLSIVELLYDDRYIQSGWILQVLSLSLAFFPFQIINSAFIVNNDWHSYSLHILILSISLFLITIAGYYFFGWIGAVWGVALYGWPGTMVIVGRAYNRGWASPLREFAMVPFILLGIVIGLSAKWLFHVL